MKFTKKKKIGFTSLGVIIIVIAWSIYSYFNKGFVFSLLSGNLSDIVSIIESFGYWAWLIFLFLIILECVFAPFPPFIIYVAGGVLFGGFNAGILATLANAIGAAIAFKISNLYGRKWASQRISDDVIKRVEKYMDKYGSISIFLLRLNPLTSTDLISYAAGLTKMKFKKFLIWTTLALMPSIFVQTYFGQGITENPLLMKLAIIAAIIYILAFIVIYFFFLRKKNKNIS